jgi:UDP:flavonoid glycosyltransferase YjiC (YdhE family)
MWCDTYDYAVRAEWLGVGVWGSRHAAPLWTADEIGQSVLRVISADEGPVYHEKAKALAPPSKEQSGSAIAAREIVRLLERQEQIQTDESSPGRLSTGSATFTAHNEL